MSSARDELRAKLLATRVATSKVITFFGEQIEIKQPTLGDILAVREDEDREAAIINTLVKYAVIPGTTEKIFEPADAASLKSLPFGGDFVAVTKALEELTSINFQLPPKTFESTPSSGGSTDSGGS